MMYCKESNISATNWLRYIFPSYLIKIWLSVWCHHWANLHILKAWISLEQKDIFEYSKQHFSSCTRCLFIFKNGCDRKDSTTLNIFKHLSFDLQLWQQFSIFFSYLGFPNERCLYLHSAVWISHVFGDLVVTSSIQTLSFLNY